MSFLGEYLSMGVTATRVARVRAWVTQESLNIPSTNSFCLFPLLFSLLFSHSSLLLFKYFAFFSKHPLVPSSFLHSNLITVDFIHFSAALLFTEIMQSWGFPRASVTWQAPGRKRYWFPFSSLWRIILVMFGYTFLYELRHLCLCLCAWNSWYCNQIAVQWKESTYRGTFPVLDIIIMWAIANKITVYLDKQVDNEL